MKTKNLLLIAILLTYSLLFSSCGKVSTPSPQKPVATNGRLDLSDWDWDSNQIITLDGEWEFYWNELFTPENFVDSEQLDHKKDFMTLPRAWNNYIIDGHKLTGGGYATYRLVITHNADEILAIKMPRIFTSYQLWANSELIASAGKVSMNNNEMTPQYLPQVQFINSEDGTIELVIQVSNYRHRSGGILESIKFGVSDRIAEERERNLSLELFQFGGLFIIGLYHLALFFFRTKDKTTLYFGSYTILISIRTLLTGEIYFIRLFPNFNWEIAHKFQTAAFYVGVLCVFLFLKAAFPKETSKKVSVVIQIISVAFTSLVLVTPARVFTLVNPLYQGFTVIVFSYLLIIIINACRKKRAGSYIIGIGVILLFLFSLNDIIFYSVFYADSNSTILRTIIRSGNLAVWGVLAFAFSQSLVVAKNFSNSFYKVEALSDELKVINLTLEEKVKLRTIALEASEKELKISYEAIFRSQKSLKNLMQNLSHDLRTPLSAIKGYANAIIDGVIDEPDQQMKSLTKITEKVNYLNNMVQELLDISELESRQAKLIFTELDLETYIDWIVEKYNFDMTGDNKTYQVDKSEELYDKGKSYMVRIDTQTMERVFSNLFSNALKYTPDGGTINLSFSLVDDKEIQIKLSDTGIGISNVDLPYIFERFYKVSKARQANSNSYGLGLAIVKEIIQYHGGEIWVTSELEQGSNFYITIPIIQKDN